MAQIKLSITLGIIGAWALAACGTDNVTEIDPLYLNNSGSYLTDMEITSEQTQASVSFERYRKLSRRHNSSHYGTCPMDHF